MSEQKLLSDIVAFLEGKIATIPEDERESLELAVDCLKETFKVESEASPQGLLAVYENGLKASPLASKASPATNVSQPEVSEEVRAEADALKAKGNKLMAARDFSAAADAYTEAIAKNSGNPLYYSNRAAAYSHLSLHSKAADDARHASELDPSYAKAWSRLGLALWALGDVKGSMEAYENGLKAEGDNPSEAMKKDYENVKRRYEAEEAKKSLEKSADTDADAAGAAGAGAGAGAGGFDFSKLAGLMNNPQVQQMAQSLMSDPGKLGDLMNSPMAQQMMKDPNMQNMMKNFQK